ncbi:TPA: SEC10/PgrA surface exclusion domain-containing protein [Streptococcus suis]|uniref:SEC10/PgrA surface exclusion domain-containing protein n=1 Tax=Streptococcus suis TaxID=1307 RepID=A0AAW9DGA9_STRSU|nr:SEC10/PgrA surface exclusion domain-containing protein [Streptococcus suis]MDX5037780.1 SEC10/PgrA surface exclusion domain-containing protein [Streptococcus suis]HEL1546717.1 SEC10/PgrA surface exclusion domain-containing protein [Streptococcus suis]HEL1551581.1 SEC10/PgrA surface exclusion domain-containing protein [Streptococcus suis]HEL1553234.1 SEC10/PgrA surface exclusion domain-containing protein [Streptococcus suis]HEL2736097.1 SEC10/PgrA surface exclusion domain-containing protein 
MKQLTVLGALATAVLSTGREVVHAEEVPQATESKPIVETSTSQQATVTETDVATAKAELDKANQTVTAQEEVVNQAQKDVDTAKETVNQAQTELVESAELAEQATPENISKAKASIKNAEATVTETSQNLEDKNQAEADSQQAVKDQKTVVSTAQVDVNEKTQAVTEAEKDVNTAQAILDGTGQAEVIAKAEQAEKQLTEAKQALVTAQTELTTAKQADKNRQTAIEEADQALDKAKQVLDAKTQVANEATAQADETAKQLATAKTIFQEAENDKNSINTITLSSEYITALRDYALNYTEKGAEATAILKALSPALKTSNQFKANANDSQTTYAVNELPAEVRQELSWFASELINQVRQAFGTANVVVTDQALEFADMVTDGYVTDNWSRSDVLTTGHDAKAINKAANQFGLATTNSVEEADGLQYYENMHNYAYEQKTITLTEAKRKVYESIVEFMFNNYEWLHAQNIAGLEATGVNYLGVDVSTRTGVTGVHFLTVDPSKLSTSHFGTELVNPNTAQAILSRFEQAEHMLSQATTTNNRAQEAKTKALKEQAESQTQVVTAQASLTKAQAVPMLTPQAQANVLTAQEAVKKAEAEHKEAQATLANLQADVKVKQANLAKAKQTLAQKQAILDKAKEQLSIEQEKLARLQLDLETAHTNVAVAQTQLSTAQSKLKEAQTYLIKLEEAPARLEVAKIRLLQASNSLKAKEAILTEALETLAELKQEEAKALNHYQTVLSAYQAVLEAQRQVELAKQYETIIHEGGQPVPVVDGTGRITGYVSEAPKAPAQTSKPITQTVPTKTTQASLPTTGTKTSSLMVLGLALASLVFFSRKKKEG